MREGARAILERAIAGCRLCPRLVRHRERVAREKRRAYRHWEYWGRPVPSFGPWEARLLIVGLAPAAHGANRTGRMFTGDRSGDFLYAALCRHGFCNQPSSRCLEDGLELGDTRVTAALHCVPPENRPTAKELDQCRGHLIEELRLLPRVRVILALGGIAWSACWRAGRKIGWPLPVPQVRFGHGVGCRLENGLHLLASYHPSQQNTQTGRLTPAMFDEVLDRAASLLKGDGYSS